MTLVCISSLKEMGVQSQKKKFIKKVYVKFLCFHSDWGGGKRTGKRKNDASKFVKDLD